MNQAAMTNKIPRSRMHHLLRKSARILIWIAIILLCLWTVAALYIDIRISAARLPLALLFAIAITVVFWKFRLRMRAALICLLAVIVILVWWLSLKPASVADWQPNVDRTASIEIHDNQVAIHNLRNCHYLSETSYSDCWSDRTLNLSDLRHMDLFFTTWGAPGIGHPIVSFDFGNGQHVAFSIEARYKVGQTYSALLGFFRQYELILVVADEGDVIRLRTNFRKDEQVFLYRLNITPDAARTIFRIYVDYLTQLNKRAEWYNALTRNCTTAIDGQISKDFPDQDPWSYRMVLNGTMDELLYSRGRLITDGLSFLELKQREHINAAGEAAGNSPDYSALIRVGRPGFK